VNVFFYKSDINTIGIGEEKGKITNIFFNSSELIKGDFIFKETDVIKEAFFQLDRYLKGDLKEFSLPLDLSSGTDFMQKVWKELMKIPYGETRTYKEIAIKIGNEKACRAVGMANNKNPIPFVIPCHRVIGTSGKLVGYRGGLEIKSYLLEMEKSN